jgi:hypothetical protein
MEEIMKTLRVLCSYLVIAVVEVVVMATNSAAQGVFRIGSWCLRGQNPIGQIIEEIPPQSGNWYLKAAEKTKLNDLGLNFFIACQA